MVLNGENLYPCTGITGFCPEVQDTGRSLHNPDAEPFSEDQTLLTLYALAGEESGGFITFRPHFFHEIGKAFFSPGPLHHRPVFRRSGCRELTEAELVRAERELWIHYHQQTADRENDRLFAAFAGTKLIGVARCATPYRRA